MPTISVSFLGLRTREFEAMRRLYAEAYGLPVLRAGRGAVWFGLADGAELHVYADTDEYHRFFGEDPVPGLPVEDFGVSEGLSGSGTPAHGFEWPARADKRPARVP